MMGVAEIASFGPNRIWFCWVRLYDWGKGSGGGEKFARQVSGSRALMKAGRGWHNNITASMANGTVRNGFFRGAGTALGEFWADFSFWMKRQRGQGWLPSKVLATAWEREA